MTTDDSAHSGSRSRGPAHFQFINPNPTILNSVVVTRNRDGSAQQVRSSFLTWLELLTDSFQLVHISTDERLAGYTAFKDANGRSVGLVEWVGGRPQVEVRGAVAKCGTGEWLKVVNDPNFGRSVMAFYAVSISKDTELISLLGLSVAWTCVALDTSGVPTAKQSSYVDTPS